MVATGVLLGAVLLVGAVRLGPLGFGGVDGSDTERSLRGVGDDRCHVLLEVDREPVVHLAVEVYRERRDAHDGSIDLDERVSRLLVDARALDDDASGDAEVAVEPRVPQPAAVVLRPDLQEPLRARLGVGLQLGARRVCVRADDDEAGSWDVGTAHGEGAHRGHVAGEEVLAAGLQLPRVALVDLLNARVARGERARGRGASSGAPEGGGFE